MLEKSEERHMEIQELRELAWKIAIARRLEKADTTNVRYNLKEVMGESEFEVFSSINPNSISDEALFE